MQALHKNQQLTRRFEPGAFTAPLSYKRRLCASVQVNVELDSVILVDLFLLIVFIKMQLYSRLGKSLTIFTATPQRKTLCKVYLKRKERKIIRLINNSHF